MSKVVFSVCMIVRGSLCSNRVPTGPEKSKFGVFVNHDLKSHEIGHRC